ncbi:MAG: TIGR04076 family protein [Thermodesulfobacteriota bacterium]|nr:TIGR04076 family protein [Thermodesulfobacteriota bacterium]
MTVECFRFENILIEVKSVEGTCKAGFHVGKVFTLEAMVPKGLCPFLYHSILPYLEAIENGAFFNLSEKNFILVQCPNPKVGVTVKIHQTKEKETQISVMAIHAKKVNCPYHHFEMGKNWLMPFNQATFCRRAYDSMFPYLNALSSQIRNGSAGRNVFSVTCPSYPNFVTFKEIRLKPQR